MQAAVLGGCSLAGGRVCGCGGRKQDSLPREGAAETSWRIACGLQLEWLLRRVRRCMRLRGALLLLSQRRWLKLRSCATTWHVPQHSCFVAKGQAAASHSSFPSLSNVGCMHVCLQLCYCHPVPLRLWLPKQPHISSTHPHTRPRSQIWRPGGRSAWRTTAAGR